MSELENLIKQFLEYLEIKKKRSHPTIRNYEFYLKRFSSWANISSPEKITQDLIRRYRLWLNRLKDERGEFLKKSTQNYHLIALRSFLKYLAGQDIKTLAPVKIELARMPERRVGFLEDSDLERLLEAPLKQRITEMSREKEGLEKNIIGLRDKAILELLFSTGLRVSELASLKKEHINFSKDEFSVQGKGSKLRVVFLSNQAKYWLKKYLEARNDASPYLFISHDRASFSRDKNSREEKSLTSRTIQRIVGKYAKFAGITKQVTPHIIRHSFATNLLRNGTDIHSVQAILGHSSITTTQIYTYIIDQQLKEVHKAFREKRRSSNK